LSVIAALAAVSVLPQESAAQKFPSGPVGLVVGFEAGGESDTGARGIAPFWEKQLGVPVVIDSRPGAGMQIALEYSWAKPHDGRTVLWHNQQYLSALEVADAEMPYRTDQWVWLDVLENDPAVIVVRSDSPWKTLEELVADMKARPGKITVGLLTGSVQLLGCKRLFDDILDVKFREVPQQSGAPMRTSLVGKHLDVICSNAAGTYSLGKDVRTLAVFNDSGTRSLPDAPPVNKILEKLGKSERIPDLGSLRGPAVPKDFVEKRPEDFKKLYAAYKAAVNSAEYQDWLKTSKRSDITQTYPMDASNQMIDKYNKFFIENKDIFLGK
jgi:tripartite-type tricarboxylate transporter receptor subunit TctC